MSQVPMIAPSGCSLMEVHGRYHILRVCSKVGGQVGRWVGRFFGQVMSPHHSDQMSQMSQVSRVTL